MAQPWVKEHKAVEIRVEWREITCMVHRMIVFHICTELEVVHVVLDDSRKRVFRCSIRQREFRLAVDHAFRTNEDYMDWAETEEI